MGLLERSVLNIFFVVESVGEEKGEGGWNYPQLHNQRVSEQYAQLMFAMLFLCKSTKNIKILLLSVLSLKFLLMILPDLARTQTKINWMSSDGSNTMTINGFHQDS